MEEMLDDAMNIEDDEEVEEEADEEVDKVLFELTNGKLGQAGTVDTQLPVSKLVYGASFFDKEFCVRLLRSTRSRQRGRWNATGSSSTVCSVVSG
jgi:predicted transposase YdaD